MARRGDEGEDGEEEKVTERKARDYDGKAGGRGGGAWSCNGLEEKEKGEELQVDFNRGRE